MHDRACVIAQAFAGSGELNAAATAADQRHAETSLKSLDPGACRCKSQIRARRAIGDAAGVGDRDEKLKIDQIKTHGMLSGHEPSSIPKAHSMSHRLCRYGRSVNVTVE